MTAPLSLQLDFFPKETSLYKMCAYAVSHIHLGGPEGVLRNEDDECLSAVVQAQPLLGLHIHLPASSLTTSPLSKNSCSPMI